MKLVDRTIRRADRVQRSRRWLGFPVAVVKKFGDDKAGYLAALIAYYGFFSLFLLLVVFVTVLGFVLRGHPGLEKNLVDSVLGQFPVIGRQIKVHALTGNAIALTLGIVGTLWSGLGGIKAAQNAMDTVWDVPEKRWPNFLSSLIRAVLMLGVFGVAIVGTTVLAALATGGGSFGIALKIAGLLGATALNFAVFMLAFRILTVEELSWGDVLPGAVFAALAWEGLQLAGAYIVGHQIKNASQTYGTFAFVIALLSWIYLGAQVTLYAAEINVVRARRLWPRALREPPETQADEITMRRSARVEERVPGETVELRFEEDDPGRRPTSGAT